VRLAEALADRVESFTGAVLGDTIACHTYATFEAKGLATGYMKTAHAFSGRSEIHVALEDGFDGAFEHELAVVLLRRTLGKPRLDSLEEGLAGWLASDRSTSLARAARLARAGVAQDVPLLFDNRSFHRDSYLTMAILSCAFVDHLIDEYGKETLLEEYATWKGGPDEIPGIIPYFDRLGRRASAPGGGKARLPEFHRGFCHAHEGYNVHDGYGSQASDRALEKLASFGTNAVSITPFTYMRNANRPEPLRFSDGSRSENDESVVHSALAAHSLGMIVMLKPHIWLTGSWPGEIEMKNEADWDRFFEYYYRWMRHYALLSEMHGIEILCVGTEISKATVGHEERWVEIFERLRILYGGRLTYAANWGNEFETVTFWGSLDFVGVNCYYPLSEDISASDEDLAAGVERALDKIENVAKRYERPALITEVGFTSAPAPWTAPHERRRGVAVDEAAQARCYQAFFKGLEGRSSIGGVYWWKWPSFLAYGGHRHSGFTPNGKEAESVVREWYGNALKGSP